MISAFLKQSIDESVREYLEEEGQARHMAYGFLLGVRVTLCESDQHTTADRDYMAALVGHVRAIKEFIEANPRTAP